MKNLEVWDSSPKQVISKYSRKIRRLRILYQLRKLLWLIPPIQRMRLRLSSKKLREK